MARALTPTLEAVENAIVAALAADEMIASYAREVRSWQGELEAAVQEGASRDPAILVMWAGGRRDREFPHFDAVWQIVVRDRNLRGEALRRIPSATNEAGAYQMVQDVWRVLDDNDLGLEGLAPLWPAEVECLQAASKRDRTVAAYLITIEARLDVLDAPGTDELVEASATYQVPNVNETTGETVWVPVVTGETYNTEE